MKTKVGLWIDHRKAIIFFITDKGIQKKILKSNTERFLSRSEVAHAANSVSFTQPPADDIKERIYMEHLDIYYDTIASCIKDAESILLFGPGESKGELKKRLEKNNSGSKIAEIETVDKMTDRQIEQKVQHYFKK
ncbi:MAG: hypothetical protein WC223_11545 [Bacteroidales bacterium]|jgi:hypothetical protein